MLYLYVWEYNYNCLNRNLCHSAKADFLSICLRRVVFRATENTFQPLKITRPAPLLSRGRTVSKVGCPVKYKSSPPEGE